VKVLLILGSNLGNREENLFRADRLLNLFAGKVIARSETLETEPFGVPNQPRFLNRGVVIDTCHPPFELLKLIKWIESRVGRYPTYRWGPRVIDIDIVYFGSLKVETPSLKIPHPGLFEREFFKRIYEELSSSLTT